MTRRFMGVRAYDVAVGRCLSPTYTRLTEVERAALRLVELDFQRRHAMAVLSSSGTLATEWMRRTPVTFTVTFEVHGRRIDV